MRSWLTLLTVVTVLTYVGAPAGAAPRGTTRLVVKVSGCEGCRILPSSSVDGGPLWETRGRRVRDGRVEFTLPTAMTKGLRLVVDAPWEGDTGGVAHVVMHYQGLRRDDPVAAPEARAARKGSVCFAGTAKPVLRLGVTVVRSTLPGATADAEPVVAALAFASTTQRSLQPFELVRDGYFATRSVPRCTGRPVTTAPTAPVAPTVEQ